MNKTNIVLYIVLLSVAFASCERQPVITPVYPPIIKAKGGLFILNEGNFQFGNASLDYYDFESEKMSVNAFEGKNNRKLGDVLQSMCKYGNSAYLVVNNSQKIEVINAISLASTATINGFKSPRYMVVANPQKAYVTEYYNGGIRVIDITTNTIASTIPVKGNLDELLIIDTRLYITNAAGKYLYVLNMNTDLITDSIEVGYGSNSLRTDSEGKLWVLCAGKSSPDMEQGALVKINTVTNTVENKFVLSRLSEHGPMKLRTDTKGKTLYWINRDVFRHKTADAKPEEKSWIVSSQNNFWALGYDSLAKEIYVGDAVDFVQRSVVSHYDENGALKGIFKAGLITGDFYFNYRQ